MKSKTKIQSSKKLAEFLEKNSLHKKDFAQNKDLENENYRKIIVETFGNIKL